MKGVHNQHYPVKESINSIWYISVLSFAIVPCAVATENPMYVVKPNIWQNCWFNMFYWGGSRHWMTLVINWLTLVTRWRNGHAHFWRPALLLIPRTSVQRMVQGSSVTVRKKVGSVPLLGRPGGGGPWQGHPVNPLLLRNVVIISWTEINVTCENKHLLDELNFSKRNRYSCRISIKAKIRKWQTIFLNVIRTQFWFERCHLVL